jgi:hypothetical protein
MSQAFAGRGTQLKRSGTTIAEITKVNQTGSKADLVDVTNMDSGSVHEKLATLIDSGEVAFEANYIPSDVTQQNLLADFNNQVLGSWSIVLPGGRGAWSFSAYVTAFDVETPVEKQCTISGKLTITGVRTFA